VKPRRVLFLIPSLDVGGAERVFTILLSRLDRGRIDPTLVLTRSGGALLGDVPRDVPVIELGCRTHAAAPLKLAGLIRRLRPDAVMATHSHLNLILGLLRPLVPASTRLIGRETSILSRHHAELGYPRLFDFLTRWCYRGLDTVVCQSADMREELAGVYRLDPARLFLLDNPVDASAVGRASLEEPGWTPRGPYLLAAGRLAPQKGFETLLAAFALLDDPGLHLVILGEGGLRGRLEAEAGRLGLSARVHLPGTARNPYPLMRRAELYVLSSGHDPFPNVLLEAGACGTPAVAFRCSGAARDIVEEGVTGFTAAPDDAADLARTIAKARAWPFDREAIRKRIAARFDVTVAVPAYESLLAS
jgi:glycosyltransferase involved in cell wall biosynthesis